ncbi:MAG: CDP-archaeol synthase [bacterium]
MWLFFLQCFYLILPGGFANAVPPVGKDILKPLAQPIDRGKTWRGQPLLGKNKTWRGVLLAIITSVLFVYLQAYLYKFEVFQKISFINYNEVNLLLLGILIGLGVMLGDAVESLIKRQMKIAPGTKFFPWDQIDSLIGGLALMAFVYVPPWEAILFLVFFAPALHVAVKHFGYLIGVNKAPW